MSASHSSYALSYNIATSHLNKGMIDEAISEYKQALVNAPGYVEVHYNLGIAYSIRGMIDEAISEYRMVLDMNPDYAEAHNNLAVAYFAKECLDLAWKHVRIAQKSNNPPHPEFLKLLKKASEVKQQ